MPGKEFECKECDCPFPAYKGEKRAPGASQWRKREPSPEGRKAGNVSTLAVSGPNRRNAPLNGDLGVMVAVHLKEMGSVCFKVGRRCFGSPIGSPSGCC